MVNLVIVVRSSFLYELMMSAALTGAVSVFHHCSFVSLRLILEQKHQHIMRVKGIHKEITLLCSGQHFNSCESEDHGIQV